MTDLRLVIFDVDGTLIDSQAHILAAMDAAFAAHGLPAPPRAATLLIVGLSLPVAMARVRRRMIWNIRGDFGAEVIGSSGSGYAALR